MEKSGHTFEGSLFAKEPLRLVKKETDPQSSNDAIPNDPKETMTCAQVAALLKCADRTVTNYRREGKLGKYWKLTQTHFLYSRKGVNEFFEKSFFENYDAEIDSKESQKKGSKSKLKSA
ncbi:helix-turn-helix domain-containing protein [Leptospira bandrabouensis]|uniref:helix-turn-helix domain-containing protein n=1 Tax=Leptospira bandrabouensis TaxID=2484903 RepID=UPI00223CF519|nr:helix-turn-helix domain-containing protein [Leptospira bandrabouensis]MCW7459565.1 helix-turn-helix domain-containing protein [Leptospira bandrabouensis]MCW7478417.1 helix-turn-helix domain-containing protein [Leptospira bandrabouensis]MCW7486299.1 helix-turn-helix domain-containing protein [Leptospira bandrabouensis]